MMTQTPKSDAAGFLANPFAHWKNDDLLLDSETRKAVEQDRPRAFRVIDWPEMRLLFAEIDERSKLAKKAVRRSGTRAVVIAASGLILAALASWLAVPGSDEAKAIGVISALLLTIGIVMGLLQLLNGKRRLAWLLTRLQAERLRQLHFQLILGNIPLVVDAMRSDLSLQQLLSLRRSALSRFKDEYIVAPSIEFQAILSDNAHENTWHNETWSNAARAASAIEPVDDAMELLDALRRLRFGVQRHYATLTVQAHSAAPGVRAKWLQFGADGLTLLLLFASVGLAVALYFGGLDEERAFVAIAAASAAGVAAFRTLEEGLRYSDDARRLNWYLAAIDALEENYDRQQARGRIRIQCNLEALSYREMREFLVTHNDARFVLQ